MKTIKILNGGLDESQLRGGSIILRGTIAPESLHLLLTDDYQRERASLSSLSDIMEAFEKNEPLPDIELGMRGQRYIDRDAYYLQDPVYIIDGLQRVTAAIHRLQTLPGSMVHLGVVVHFETNKEWERQRFETLNTRRRKVSPNVILRNKRDGSPAMLMLYGLSMNDKAFPLHERISWAQRMSRSELVTALMFAKVAGRLHSHYAAAKRSSIAELVPALDKAVEDVGVQNMRDNMKVFFDFIDTCWGLRRVEYREGAVQLRGTFLRVLAQFLSDHHDFWRQPDEKRLVIEASLRRKFAQFNIFDPQVVNLAGSAGKAAEMLYVLLKNHINSGKRTKRLESRTGDVIDVNDRTEEEESSAAA